MVVQIVVGESVATVESPVKSTGDSPATSTCHRREAHGRVSSSLLYQCITESPVCNVTIASGKEKAQTFFSLLDYIYIYICILQTIYYVNVA